MRPDQLCTEDIGKHNELAFCKPRGLLALASVVRQLTLVRLANCQFPGLNGCKPKDTKENGQPNELITYL